MFNQRHFIDIPCMMSIERPPDHLQRLEQHLLKQRESLRREESSARVQQEAVRAESISVEGAIDTKDLAQHKLETQEAANYLARVQRELAAVEHALERLRDGTYGLCVDCGQEIAAERLRVQPEIMRCLTCQQRHEKARAGSHGRA